MLGTGGHMLGSRLEGTEQRKLFFFSAFQATSTLIGKNDRHPRQPLSSGINSVSVAVSTVCADVTDSREAGKAMTCMRITRRPPYLLNCWGFLFVLLSFQKNMPRT